MKKFLFSIVMGLSFIESCFAADPGSAFAKYAAQELGYTSACSIMTDENGRQVMLVERFYRDGTVEREFHSETSMRFKIFYRQLKSLNTENAEQSKRPRNSSV